MIFVKLLMAATFITGIIYFLDLLVLKKIRSKSQKPSLFIEYGKSFFPILLAVFIIRSFIVEPFKIPSGSMMPTLIAGDFIVVNKFAYGVRFPIWNKILINLGTPNRGDIFVFHYPKNPSIDYIKRVIGLPGDEIRYENKQLFINGEAINKTFQSKYSYAFNDDESLDASEFIEELNNSKYSILIHDIPSENYKFNVPEGYYFAMGDNRDNSSDSRVWGFVPDELLVGKAFFIWLNFSEFNRIGTWIK
ncbi:MAG: signal peptidase I [Nitrosomonadales bacterium]|nr:signal peptidase I [Nitrosomonadales bacterium]|tara:strand:+ start:21 stop:764 length:744 start_codon:yes stop_codon:yes gene_type:complete